MANKEQDYEPQAKPAVIGQAKIIAAIIPPIKNTIRHEVSRENRESDALAELGEDALDESDEPDELAEVDAVDESGEFGELAEFSVTT